VQKGRQNWGKQKQKLKRKIADFKKNLPAIKVA
jgi:hypothetical protein